MRLRRITACGVALLALATPAIAQVCDTERPNWNPTAGPASTLDELAQFMIEPLGLAVLALGLLAVSVQWRWLTALAGVSACVALALIVIDFVIPDAIKLAAMEEGCIGPPYMTLIFLAAFVTVKGWLTFRPPQPA
ncbi:MAG: hypothetical protein AAGF13_07070 [Pseudomonadota bacterium]